MQDTLTIHDCCPIRAIEGGLFISKGQEVRTAFQHDGYELMFVKHGVLRLFEENTTYNVAANQAYIVWPGSNHGIVLSESDDVSFYWALFSVEPEKGSPDGRQINIPKLCNLNQPERLMELFHRYLDDLRTDRLSEMMGTHLIALMLCEIDRSLKSGDQTKGKMESLVDTVQVYISRHFHESISTCTVAQALNYNPDYLERVFRNVTEMSITEAIHRKRIKEARRQLIHEYRNISEVAYACGFSDSGYFRRVFKRHTDMTPTKFRSLYSQVHMKVS